MRKRLIITAAVLVLIIVLAIMVWAKPACNCNDESDCGDGLHCDLMYDCSESGADTGYCVLDNCDGQCVAAANCPRGDVLSGSCGSEEVCCNSDGGGGDDTPSDSCTGTMSLSFSCRECNTTSDFDGKCGICCEHLTETNYRCALSCLAEEEIVSDRLCGDDCSNREYCCESTPESFVAKTCLELSPENCGTCGCDVPEEYGPCEDRTTSTTCGETNDCMWCPTPQDDNLFPYTFPGVEPSEKHTCVNITDDPLNCGRCGFRVGATDIRYNKEKGGFCPADAPYCVNSECVAKPNANSADVPGNPMYYYTTEEKTDGSYVSSWGDSGNTKPMFRLYDINNDEDVCSKAIGSSAAYDEDLGCCGDGKCKEVSGTLCGVSALCDGSQWRDAKDSSDEGSVFRLPDCSADWDNYPVADIGNEFIRCVDYDDKSRYLNVYDAPPGRCYPANPGGGVDSFTRGGDDYLCEETKYTVGGVRALKDNICAGHGIYARDVAFGEERNVDLVCDVGVSGDTFAFASIVDSPGADSGTSTIGLESGREDMNYENCPAAVTKWIVGGDDQIKTILNVPCPGKMSLKDYSLDNEFTLPGSSIERTWLFSLGSTFVRTAVLCRPPLENEDFFTRMKALDFVFSNGSVMGDVEGNEYACIDSGGAQGDEDAPSARIAICCGDDGCSISGSTSGAEMFDPGDFVEFEDSMIYCLPDGSWGSDLDSELMQDECRAAGETATGSYCCAEKEDTSVWINESYNDPDSETGACFKGEAQTNQGYLYYNDQEYDNVFVSSGEFFGCGFEDEFIPEFEQGASVCQLDSEGRFSSACLSAIEDWPNSGANFSEDSPFRTGFPLIKRSDYCTLINVSSGLVYCSHQDKWLDSMMENLSHSSTVPDDLLAHFENLAGGELEPSACCKPSQCWDPNVGACINEQLGASDYYELDENTVYKCLAGHWVNVMGEGKRTPDGCFVGICPSENQCLYDIGGSPSQNNNVSSGANPQCIADGQYIGDYVCNNGNWTTRTRALALKMASLFDDDAVFQLMCGPAEKVLVNKQNIGESNNFCVLNINSQRIIGTTLNQPLYDPSHNDFITALEQSFYMSYADLAESFNSVCSSTTDDFQLCVDNDYLKLYYDDDYQTVVFSSEDISGLTPGLGSTICSSLPSWLKWLCPGPNTVEQNIENAVLFNQVYAARRDMGSLSQEVFGLSEKQCNPANLVKEDEYTFKYSGFSSVDLSYLITGIDADQAELIDNGKGIYIRDPDSDAWPALTLLRNPEQR